MAEILPSNKRARILIIDDDQDFRAVLNEILRSAGHTVALAADGDQGMQQFKSEPADLVVSDLYMPGKEGLETILEFRRLFPRLPIIAMSGNPIAGTMLAIARHLGAAATLQKPFSPQELLDVIEKAL